MVDSNIGQIGGVAIIVMAFAGYLFTGVPEWKAVGSAVMGFLLLIWSND